MRTFECGGSFRRVYPKNLDSSLIPYTLGSPSQALMKLHPHNMFTSRMLHGIC